MPAKNTGTINASIAATVRKCFNIGISLLSAIGRSAYRGSPWIARQTVRQRNQAKCLSRFAVDCATNNAARQSYRPQPDSTSHTADVTRSWISLSLAFFFAELIVAPIWAVPMDIAPRYAGTASGMMNFGSALAGIVSPLFFGYMIDRTGSWTWPFA